MSLFWRRALPSTPSSRPRPEEGEKKLTEPGEAPFVLEEREEEVEVSGAFTPRSALWLSPSLAGSGLLRDLAPEELRLLLGVLSCLSPNGTFLATPERVSGVLGVSTRDARRGLEGLCGRLWHDHPLLLSHTSPSGLHFFLPAPHLLDARRSVITPAPSNGERVRVPEVEHLELPQREGERGLREAVVAHSRSLYARPRAQVEAEIEAFLQSGRTGGGSIKVRTPPAWDKAIPKEETPNAVTPEARKWLALKRALVEMGIAASRADELLSLYPHERIERQLRWLPRRQARSPVAYLLAAIEHDYAPPSGSSPPPPTEEQNKGEASQTN